MWDHIRGQRVYRDHWNNAEVFVLDALIGAKRGLTKDVTQFLAENLKKGKPDE